ncbi:MAG: hypothetical protein ORN85_02120 [Sediminibacterium sp.]|nr:hypothetical protein [Sediminibacterium sp.]
MIISKNPNLSSGILTIIICIALYLILINIFLKESLKIEPLYEFIDVALGPDIEGKSGQNEAQSSFSNEAQQTSQSQQTSNTASTLPLETADNEDPDNTIAIKKNPKKTKITPINKDDNKTITEAKPSPKAILKKQDLNKVNNTLPDQSGLNQGEGTKEGIAGNPNGNPNSTNYSGQLGYSVVNGDRKITYAEQFIGDVDAATIYAKISVNEAGKGNFIDFDRGSSSQNDAYKIAIKSILEKMKFNTSNHRSIVVVKFNFIVQ